MKTSLLSEAFLLFVLHVQSRSCILTKETTADCWLRDSNGAFGVFLSFIKMLMHSKCRTRKHKLCEEGKACLVKNSHQYTKEGGVLSSLDSFYSLFFHCSISRLHQHFLFIWKQGIMQERQQIGNFHPSSPLFSVSTTPTLLSLSLSTAEHVNL